MKWVLRTLATAWAGSMGAVAVWAAIPLLAARPTVGIAAIPVPGSGRLVGVESSPTTGALSLSPSSAAPKLTSGSVASGSVASGSVASLVSAPASGFRTAGQAEFDLAQLPPSEWLPPDWYPAGTDVLALSGLDTPGPRTGPHVKSRSAMVYDISAGEVLFEKNADDPRPVASITKVVSALAWVSSDPDFDREVEIGAEQYPSRSGARSRLSTGDVTTGLDLLGAALVSSDNRAALGLAAASNMHLEQFIGRMNAVSVELGMTHSSWVDPSGLEDENLSTARDIAKATLAVANHPVLASVASAPFWDLWRKNKDYVRRLGSTDRLQGRDDIVIEAAKTGYTDTARYCFTTVLETPTGRRLAITLLGADGKLTRWADIGRIVSWVDAGQSALQVDKAASEKVRPAPRVKRRSSSRKRRQ